MQSRTPEGAENPLASEDPSDWDRLVEALGESSLLVVIEGRMSQQLLSEVAPEDVLQEALLMIWRDRSRIDWHGLHVFRRYFLQVVNHRIHDLVDHVTAQKRGGSARRVALSHLDPDGAAFLLGLQTTTPSRIAAHREEAEAMRASLEQLPAEVRSVVFLRLFEEKSTAEVAAELGLTESAVKHRLRRGSAQYRQLLHEALATRSHSKMKSRPDM